MTIEHPIILIFNMDAAKEAALSNMAAAMHIEAKHMSESDMRTPLGALAGAGNWFVPASAGNPPADSDESRELIILCGIEDRKLDRLLAKMRAIGLSVPYKAVLTPTNAMWNAVQITAEIKAERAAYGQS